MTIIFILGIVITVIYYTNKKTNNDIYTYTDLVATIYHYESIGMDAGTTYIYNIYLGKDNSYICTKTKENVTVAGVQKQNEEIFDRIKTKKDMEKITKDIEKNKMQYATTDIQYIYTELGEKITCKSIEDLTNRLFK